MILVPIRSILLIAMSVEQCSVPAQPRLATPSVASVTTSRLGFEGSASLRGRVALGTWRASSRRVRR